MQKLHPKAMVDYPYNLHYRTIPHQRTAMIRLGTGGEWPAVTLIANKREAATLLVRRLRVTQEDRA